MHQFTFVSADRRVTLGAEWDGNWRVGFEFALNRTSR